MEIQILKVNEDATLPKKAHDNDQCWDLFAAEYAEILPWHTVAVTLGIKVILPEGYGFEFRERSGLALNNGVIIGGGIIDNGYVGEWKVIVHNNSHESLTITRGSKIAQGELVKIINSDIVEISQDKFNELQQSKDSRGEKGFGSSGK